MKIIDETGAVVENPDLTLGYLTDDTEKLLTQYAKLDDYGRHTISAVMQVEYDRCTELSKPDLEEHTSVNI